MGRAVILELSCAIGLLLYGCAAQGAGENESDGDPDAVGSVAMNLEIQPGVDIESVSYTVTGGAALPISGTLPVTLATPPISGTITGVPAGEVELRLVGTARDGTRCEGKASTNVIRGRLSLLAIVLQCLARKNRGNDLDVKGEFNICPEAELATCTLARAAIGVPIALSAQGSDPDGDPLTFKWSATSGSFSSPNTSSTEYTCTATGAQKLTFTVDDGQGCKDKHEFTLYCDKLPPPAPICGNGRTESGESCDDGNTAPGDGCAPNCTREPAPSLLCGADATSFIPRCACENCRPQIQRAEASALAVALVECVQDTGCRGIACLCGTFTQFACELGNANGPCENQFLAAAGTSDPQIALLRRNNTNLAIGLATAVETCTVTACDSQCPQ